MNITKLPFVTSLKYCKTNAVNFKGTAPIPYDTFEKSDNTPSVKKVTIKNLNNEPVEAAITETTIENSEDFSKKFILSVDGKKLGYAIVGNNRAKNELRLKELYTEENYARHYKGAGTELLKSVILESKKRGYKGAVRTTASNFPPPFVFYYKNNFTVNGSPDIYNAAVDYAARNNISVSKILHVTFSALNMYLDEKGADAVLKGERLFEKRKFETICTKTIKNKSCDANWIQAPDSKDGYLQIINNDNDKIKQRYVASTRIAKDEDGKEYLELYNQDDTYAEGTVKHFVLEAASIMAEKLGLDGARILEDCYIDYL